MRKLVLIGCGAVLVATTGCYRRTVVVERERPVVVERRVIVEPERRVIVEPERREREVIIRH